MITDLSNITKRLQDLVTEGNQLLRGIADDRSIGLEVRAACLAWMFSAVHVLEISMPVASRYKTEATRLLPKADDSFAASRVAAILGILKSATSEWSAGLIGTLEFHFVGLAFEDFLKLAAEKNESGQRDVAAILACAVFEDAVKRLSRKHGVNSTGQTLEPLLNSLKSKGVLSKLKAERLKSHVKVRNQAFHAQWDQFEKPELRRMIEDLEELIETHFVEQHTASA